MTKVLFLSLLVVAAACVGQNPIDGNTTCPCASGWTCDPITNMCARAAADLDCTTAQPATSSVTVSSQENLDGMPLISEIQGDLKVTGNMTTLAHLGCLRSVTGTVYISDLPNLDRLDGLERLE